MNILHLCLAFIGGSLFILGLETIFFAYIYKQIKKNIKKKRILESAAEQTAENNIQPENKLDQNVVDFFSGTDNIKPLYYNPSENIPILRLQRYLF
jgi:hypothetical protein